MGDIKTKDARSKNMSAIRSRDTKPELYIRKELYKRGYRYRIAPEYITGHPDMFFRKYNLAVFVHGCFWHRHQGCKYAYTPKSNTEFWNLKFDSNQRRDREVMRVLRDEGIRILIVWECAIKQAQSKKGNPLGLFDYIENTIKSDIDYREVGYDAYF